MPTSRAPQSTGELFNSAWLESKLKSFNQPVTPVDVRLWLSVIKPWSHSKSMANRRKFMFAVEAHNSVLMEGLANALALGP